MITKNEFFKQNYLDGLNTLNAIDEMDDQSSWIYEAFSNYRSLPLDEFLEGEEIFETEADFLEYVQGELDRIIQISKIVKKFIKKRQKGMTK